MIPGSVAATVAVVVALIALLGVILTGVITLLVAHRNRAADRRVELFRTIRWAAELATDKDDDASMAIGIGVLDAIDDAKDLQGPEDQALISAILDAVVEDRAEQFQPGTSYEQPQIIFGRPLFLEPEYTESEDPDQEEGGNDDSNG